MEAKSVKWNIRKDDIVQVMTGREKGKKGKVLNLIHDQERVKIEKLNLYKRHTKAGKKGQSQQGGIVEKEGSIHISNVLLVCDKCGKGVRVRRKKLEDGKRVRMCGKCGEVIDKT